MGFLRLLEAARVPALDAFFSGVTYFGDELAFMTLALLIFWCVDKRMGYYCFAVGLFGTLGNQFLKILCRVPRPWVLDPSFTIVESARAAATGYSFPSGHTQNAVGTFGSVGLLAKRRWVKLVCLALVLLVPFSRMYLGVHTPLDVGVAFLMAAILLAALYPVFRSEARTKKAMPYLLAAGIALAVLFVFYVSGIRADFAPGSEEESNLAHAVKNAWTLLGAIAGLFCVFFLDSRGRNFDTCAPFWGQVLKFSLGLLLIVGIKAGLKPLLHALLPSGPAGALRYFLIVVFAGLVWPRTFPRFAGLSRKKED